MDSESLMIIVKFLKGSTFYKKKTVFFYLFKILIVSIINTLISK